MNQEERLLSAICKDGAVDLMYGDIDEFFVSNQDVLKWIRDHYSKYRSFPTHNTVQTKWAHLSFDGQPDTAEVELEKLQAIFLKKTISELLQQQNQMLKSGMSPTAVLSSITESASRLYQKHAPIQDVDITETEDAVKDYQDRAKRLAENGSVGIQTGLKAFDDSYPTGLAPGQFISILAWSGRGKSWFSSLLAYNAWKQGYTPLIVSLEMNTATVRDRLYTVAGNGRLSNTALTSGQVDIEDFTKWAKETFDKGREERTNKFIIVATEAMDSVRPITIQSKLEQHRPDMLIVDYHTLLDDNKGSGGAMERAKNVSRELKLMAVSYQIPVIDLNQATASDLSVPTGPPLIEQVAWSRSIQQDSDLAVGVHFNDEGNEMHVISRKNRHGPDFSFFLDWDINTGKIKEKFHRVEEESEW